MNDPGEADSGSSGGLLVRSRSALLDALEALADHRRAVVVIGAQAVYLRTGSAPVALAEATKDSIWPSTLETSATIPASSRP